MVLARFRWFQLVLDCIFIIEICQFHNTIELEISKGIFQIKNDQHKFRSDLSLQGTNVNNALCETFALLRALIWNLVPNNLQCLKSFDEFKIISMPFM